MHYRDQIDSGQMQPGDLLPSVRELATALDISHATAAKVVAKLKAEGYVTTSTGGAVVATRARRTSDYLRAIRPTGKICAGGSYARITAAELVQAGEPIAAALGVKPGEQVIRRSRSTFNSQDVPRSASSATSPACSPRPRRSCWWRTGSRRGPPATSPSRPGARSGAPRSNWRPGAASEHQAADLTVAPGSPVLLGRHWIHDDAGEVIEYGESCSVAGRWLTFEGPA